MNNTCYIFINYKCQKPIRLNEDKKQNPNS